jgi:hypothetical protein
VLSIVQGEAEAEAIRQVHAAVDNLEVLVEQRLERVLWAGGGEVR